MMFAKTALKLFLAAGVLSQLALADDPIPATATGTWTGTRQQSFALANATDPSSNECLPSGTISSRSATLTASSTGNAFGISNVTMQSLSVGAANYVAPAINQQQFKWSEYNATTHILKLRDASDNIVCHYATMSGTGSSRKIVVVTLGGAAYTNDWMLQCQPSSYANIPNIETAPYCASPAGSRVAENSTVLHTFNYQSGGNVGNGAGSATFVGGVLAAVGAAAGALIFG